MSQRGGRWEDGGVVCWRWAEIKEFIESSAKKIAGEAGANLKHMPSNLNASSRAHQSAATLLVKGQDLVIVGASLFPY